MTKREFQLKEYVAEATEQQSSQVGDGPNRQAMNPDVQSAANILMQVHTLLVDEWDAATKAMYELESEGDDDSSDYGELLGVRAIVKRVYDCIKEAIPVEQEAKRLAAD